MNATDKTSLVHFSNILSTQLETKTSVKEWHLLYPDLNPKHKISSLIFNLDLKFGLPRLSVYKQGFFVVSG